MLANGVNFENKDKTDYKITRGPAHNLFKNNLKSR